MILAMIRITPRLKTRREILEILRNAEFLTRAKPGCLGAAVYVKKFEEEVVLYLEHWQSAEDFERHVHSTHYDRILAALDLARDPPEVHFFGIDTWKGLDWIEDIRNRGTRTERVFIQS
jgi:quinol monooxygenase YgiN